MMMSFTDAMRDLMAADGTSPDERVQAWRKVLMGVWNVGFGDGYAACAADASVRTALAYPGDGRFTSTPAPVPVEGPAAPVANGSNGGPVNGTSTLIH